MEDQPAAGHVVTLVNYLSAEPQPGGLHERDHGQSGDFRERRHWESNSEKHSASERAAAKFAPHLRKLTAVGFDHADHVIDTDADDLARLDAVADKVREHLARPSRP